MRITGAALTLALLPVTATTPEELASHDVGAPLQALILARADTATVLRLAERAVCRDAGRLWAVSAVVGAR